MKFSSLFESSNNLEKIVVSKAKNPEGYEIFYDRKEGKFYNKTTDTYLSMRELKTYGLTESQNEKLNHFHEAARLPNISKGYNVEQALKTKDLSILGSKGIFLFSGDPTNLKKGTKFTNGMHRTGELKEFTASSNYNYDGYGSINAVTLNDNGKPKTVKFKVYGTKNDLQFLSDSALVKYANSIMKDKFKGILTFTKVKNTDLNYENYKGVYQSVVSLETRVENSNKTIDSRTFDKFSKVSMIQELNNPREGYDPIMGSLNI